MQTQIKTLRQQGLSIRKVAHALGISRQTVRKYERPSEKIMDMAAPSSPTEGHRAWQDAVNWEQAVHAVRMRSATAKQLHQENAPGVSYWQFWRHLRGLMPKQPEISLRREHRVGERTEIDYADGIDIVDARTGETRKTHLFCGVLPFSSYTFGEFSWNQQLPSFIASHERMWHFFGGVTPYVVPDNLKSGVQKAHRYDPDINPVYCDFANHVGFAVLPARPYKPRDKAVVEATIGVIQRGFYVEVRDQIFYDLATLNDCFAKYLERLNNAMMKDYGVSRLQRFDEERRHLKPLPQTRFEMCEWRRAKVHPDCHIQLQRNFYSVPFSAVGTTVRVRLTGKLVEIFNAELQALAAHTRLHGVGGFSTDEQHYPEKKLGIKRFEVRSAEKFANDTGPHTAALVRTLICADYPLRHLRRIQGILRLLQSGHVSRDAMEYACQMALKFNKPRFAYVKSCAEHYQANGCGIVAVKPIRRDDTMYLHGKATQNGGTP